MNRTYLTIAICVFSLSNLANAVGPHERYTDARLIYHDEEPIKLINYMESLGGALIQVHVTLGPCEQFAGALKTWNAGRLELKLKNVQPPAAVICEFIRPPGIPVPTHKGILFVKIRPGDVLYVNHDPYRFDGEGFIPPTQ